MQQEVPCRGCIKCFSSTTVSISFCTVVCNAGFQQVVKEAEQKAKAAAKFTTAAAISSPGKRSASTGKKGQAASAKAKTALSAKHVTKKAQLSTETAPQPAEDSTINLDRASAQVASARVVTAGTKEAPQQNAAQLRQQRYLARQWTTPAQAPSDQQQGQGRGQDHVQHQGQGNMQERQLVDLKSPTDQGRAQSTPSLQAVLAGQGGAKRRKLGPEFMESVANSGDMTSAAAQVGTACNTEMFAGSHCWRNARLIQLAQDQVKGIMHGQECCRLLSLSTLFTHTILPVVCTKDVTVCICSCCCHAKVGLSVMAMQDSSCEPHTVP